MMGRLSVAAFLLILLALMIPESVSASQKRPLCVAHRGGAAYAPENTISAFKNAIRMKADYMELDVHMSRDGHVVVIHDETLDRTTNGVGLVRDMSLAQLRELDAGSWFSKEFEGEKIPTLREALELARGRIGVVIEIKNGPVFYEGIEEEVVKLVDELEMVEDVIIISFDHASIRKAHRLNPDIAGGILFYGNILDVDRVARNSKAQFVCPGWKLLTPEMISDCHDRGLKLNTWTVNDEAVMTRFIREGVDMITTDRPDVLIRLIDEFHR